MLRVLQAAGSLRLRAGHQRRLRPGYATASGRARRFLSLECSALSRRATHFRPSLVSAHPLPQAGLRLRNLPGLRFRLRPGYAAATDRATLRLPPQAKLRLPESPREKTYEEMKYWMGRRGAQLS